MGEYHLEDEVWDEVYDSQGDSIITTEIRDKDNRLFIFVHGNNDEQQNFIIEATDNNCFAQPVNFMTLQAGKDIYTNKIYHKDKEIIELEEVKRLWNGVRPYFTISNANPDRIAGYCNWTYLESAIETGWKRQFPSWE